MREQLPRTTNQSSRTKVKTEGEGPTEVSPLLRGSATASFFTSGAGATGSNISDTQGIRARRSQSKSPGPTTHNSHFQQETTLLKSSDQPMYQATAGDAQIDLEGTTDYTEISYHSSSRQSQHAGLEDASQSSNLISRTSSASARTSHAPVSRNALVQEGDSNASDGNSEHPPLLEIPEEVYAVRKSALQVLKPLTRTWVSFWNTCAVRGFL